MKQQEVMYTSLFCQNRQRIIFKENRILYIGISIHGNFTKISLKS